MLLRAVNIRRRIKLTFPEPARPRAPPSLCLWQTWFAEKRAPSLAAAAAAAAATAAAAAAEVTEERGASSLPPPPDVNAQAPARQRFSLEYTLHIYGDSECEGRLLPGSAQRFC